MSGEAGPSASRAEQVKEAWRLAGEARLAFEAAKASADRAVVLRQARTTKRSENLPPLQDSDESWDLRPDIKIRGELLRVAEKCVPTWLSLPWGNDPFMAGAGLSSDQVRGAQLRLLWRQVSPDGKEVVDGPELAAGLALITRAPVSVPTVAALMLEAGAESTEGVLSERQFVMPVLAVLDRAEQALLVEEQERREKARMRTPDQIEACLANVTLAGGGRETAKQLDTLKEKREILFWNSAFASYENTTVDRMREVTGMGQPDEQLGLRPRGLIAFRYKGLSYLGIISISLLLWAGFFANKVVSSALFSSGLVTGVVYIIGMMFQAPIDRFLRMRHTRLVNNGIDRWARRESGKVMCSYLLGIPLEAVAFPLKASPSSASKGLNRLRQFSVYGRREGEWNMDELQRSAARDGYMSAGLTKQQAVVHAVIHMAGIVAEWLRYGNATEGYRSVAEMERHLQFSQRSMPIAERQALARLGVVVAFRLLSQHAIPFDAMVASFKSGDSVGRMLSEFEAAPRPKLPPKSKPPTPGPTDTEEAAGLSSEAKGAAEGGSGSVGESADS